MPRKPRIDFPGAWHHVMHRGARRAPIFRGDDDWLRFLSVVDDAVGRFGMELAALFEEVSVRSPGASRGR